MKAHVGVNTGTVLIHSVIGTAGNVSDATEAHALLHGDETVASGEAGHQGIRKRSENSD